MAQISVRVDDKVKAEAAKNLEEIGLDQRVLEGGCKGAPHPIRVDG